MIVTTHLLGGVLQVDARRLTEDEIRTGVMTHGMRMGSFGYFIADEIARCLRDRAGIAAFLDERDHTLRVFYRQDGDRVALASEVTLSCGCIWPSERVPTVGEIARCTRHAGQHTIATVRGRA